MRLARIRANSGVWLGDIDGDSARLIVKESSHPAADVVREALAAKIDLNTSSMTVDLAGSDVLAPIASPAKIICIGLNYADHAAEAGVDPPDTPVMFAKFSNTLISATSDLHYRPEAATQLDFEAELGVIVGRECSRVGTDEAGDAVLGYTIINDVSARNAQFADGQWVRGKSFDNFCPIGPVICTPDEIDDVQALGVRCLVNGKIMQDGTTSDMIFTVAEIISYISQFITLVPGDVIATGTPAGVGVTRKPPVLLTDGDELVTQIDGIGELRNRIIGC